MQGIRVRAPAKINLFLHVGDKRLDGYHDLQSLTVFAETGDELEFFPAADISLTVEGPFQRDCPSDDNNLIFKATRALNAVSQVNKGTRILLKKNLPVASGIGGGSADAAAALRALNRLWSLDRSEFELVDIAGGLGSDIPACILSQPCWMEGRGERISETPLLPSLPIVLVNPGVATPTSKVFAALNARTGAGAMHPPSSDIKTVWDLVNYLGESNNDLEAPACELYPVIEDVLSALDIEPGCVLAQMSGSGATCFGMFEEPMLAASAAGRIAIEHPDWWVVATKIAGPDIGVPHRMD